MGGGRGEGGARESISVLDRETKTGQCLNIEHMSLSPLKRANENRSHHCGPPYVRPSCRTEREREREILFACLFCGLVFAVTRPPPFSRGSAVRLVPASFLPSPFLLFIFRLFSRRGEERERVTRECWFLSLSIHPSFDFSFRDKWIEICKGYILF